MVYQITSHSIIERMTQVCCPRLRATVEEMTRARVNTDNELVNLRINLEEAKNENVTILQVRLARVNVPLLLCS